MESKLQEDPVQVRDGLRNVLVQDIEARGLQEGIGKRLEAEAPPDPLVFGNIPIPVVIAVRHLRVESLPDGQVSLDEPEELAPGSSLREALLDQVCLAKESDRSEPQSPERDAPGSRDSQRLN
jgi:hypothetical protein